MAEPLFYADRRVDADQAQRVHNAAIRNDLLVIWTVTWGTADHGDCFIARPQTISAGRADHLNLHLAADTLDDLRSQLPAGLSRLDPDPNDDPVIVEVWL